VIGLLKRAAGFAADDHAAARLDKLEALLALSTDDVTGVAPLLAALLSLKTDARYPPLDMSPHRQKERTLEELVDQVLGLAMRRPVLALYEDVHWADRIDSINATRHRRDVGSWPILLKKSKMLPTQNTRKSLLAADFF
jgi:predicted ATPase